MKAWTIDAGNIDLGEINTNDLGNFMVATRDISDFLSKETDKMFIVAPKGLGKTYLLKIKSQLYRDSDSSYKFIPNDNLCERFVSNETTFSQSELEKFNERSIWKKTWELCLYTLILRNFKNDSLPNEIQKIIGDNTGSLGEILGMFLQYRGQIEKLHSYVASDLRPAIRKLKDNSTANQIAIFIDNVDETFDNYVGFDAQKQGNIVSSDLWINVQLSLLSVSKDICAINNHIKIFLTIRSEAYNNFNDPQKLQIDSLCLFLQYTKDQIKDIFIKNILLMPEKELVSHRDQNKIKGFMGYSSIPHKFIENEDGTKREEDFFDFIYRHTYARPREIVEMGEKLSRLNKEERKNFLTVGTLVNKVSYDLFSQLTNEIIPVFESEIFNAFCKKTSNNVIAYSEASTISEEIEKQNNFKDVFSYFYRLGLIGIVQNDFNENGKQGFQKQFFLPVGQYTLGEEKIPDCRNYVLHPSLNKKMRELHEIGFYDNFNIIGYDYPFDSQKHKTLKHHIHFGIDRDSLSILVSEIENSKQLAVVGIPNNEWSGLDACNITTLEINNQDFNFKIFRETLTDVEKEQIISDWINKKYHVLLYTNSAESISKFYDKVSAVSFCIYNPHSSLLSELIKKNQDEKIIYYCIREFVKSDVGNIKKTLNSINAKLIFETVLIDRYQFTQEVLHIKEEKLLKIIIEAEDYYKIICKERPNSSIKSSEKIIRVSNDKSYEILIKKQNLLNEGIYQFIKLLYKKGFSIPNSKSIIEEFINIQVSKIISELPEKKLHDLFEGKNRSTIFIELKKEANLIVGRVIKIITLINLSGKPSSVALNKRKNIFLQDKEIFSFLKLSENFFKNSLPFIELLQILEVKPLKNYHDLFISYSYKDRKIVTEVYNRLILLGLDVNMYEKDNPSGMLPEYMRKSVIGNEKMLFIASENSLKSEACHFELTTCFSQMEANNDSTKLSCIRLDNYIFDNTLFENSMLKPERKSNIHKLKTLNMNKLLNFEKLKEINLDTIKSIHSQLEKLVKESYLKKVN